MKDKTLDEAPKESLRENLFLVGLAIYFICLILFTGFAISTYICPY